MGDSYLSIPDGTLHNVPDQLPTDLGIELRLMAINDKGQMVGGAIVGDELHAVMISPAQLVPDPGSFMTFTPGLVLLTVAVKHLRMKRSRQESAV